MFIRPANTADGLSDEFGGSNATQADRVYAPQNKEILGFFLGFSLATVGQFELSPHVMFSPDLVSAGSTGRRCCSHCCCYGHTGHTAMVTLSPQLPAPHANSCPPPSKLQPLVTAASCNDSIVLLPLLLFLLLLVGANCR